MFITFWSFQIEININQRQVGEAGLGPAVLPNPTPDVLVIEVGNNGDHDDAHDHDVLVIEVGNDGDLDDAHGHDDHCLTKAYNCCNGVFIDFLKDGPRT